MNTDKTTYCTLFLTYKSGIVREVNAYGGQTYIDALQIGKNYMAKHPKVCEVGVYGYGCKTDGVTFLKNLIN